MTNTNPTDDKHAIDRRTVLKLASFVGLGAAFSGTGLADDPSQDGGPVEPDGAPPWQEQDSATDQWAEDLWFVEFEAPPTARGGTPSEHADERAQLRAEAREENVAFAERRDFDRLWNGLSVDADLADAYAMSGLDSVEAVYPVALVEPPEPEEASPELGSAVSMTGADRAQMELGYTGAGSSVGIIDTGIDYNHPDLGGSGDPENVIEADEDRTFDHSRISHGWDYVGEHLYDGDPNPDPMDPRGHGTHVAGIAGADADDSDEGVTGVAPEIELGAYKVFPPSGATTADVMVEALEDAYEDGMDVVNMSIGASLTWGQEYPSTAASNELANQGVVVVNSAGNDGGLGAWSLSAPANAHDIISAASVENEFFQAPAFEVAQLEEPVPYDPLTGAENPPTEGESAPLALPSKSEEGGEEGYFGCNPEDFDDFPEGHVALIERGHCLFADKYLNAVDAGATGVVIFNNISGLFSGTITDAGVEGVWGAGTTMEAGSRLVDLLEAGEDVTLDFTDQQVTVENPDGGLLSSFSSYGQDVELAFGPSVAAPGGQIRSTYPLRQNEYASLSGTSMAAPHTAGAAALLLEAEEWDVDPFDVRDRLQNTAEPLPWSLAPSLGFLDHSFRQGAGMVQIDRAIEAEQTVEPGQIAAGDGDGISTTITVRNDGDEDVEYSVGHTGTLGTLGSTFTPTFWTPGSDLDAPETVTVPAGGSTEVDVTITAPGSGLSNHQYGGYVTLTPQNEDASTLRVPYAGYDGDYQDLELFGYYTYGAGATEFVEQEPRLSRIVYDEDGEFDGYEPVDEGREFAVGDEDFPVVEAFFGHSPQEMQVYAVHQASGREWPVMENEYVSRSPDPNTFRPFVWPGTTQAGRSDNLRPLASGTYTLRVEVLRTLGDPDDEDHWDTWESPEFELDTRVQEQRAIEGAPSSASPADE